MDVDPFRPQPTAGMRLDLPGTATEREPYGRDRGRDRGTPLRLSNLDKVLWPRSGFTKGQMIDYYRRISGPLLNHLRDRPLTLKRYPEGVDAEFFYEKRCPPHRPPWIATCPIPRRSTTG